MTNVTSFYATQLTEQLVGIYLTRMGLTVHGFDTAWAKRDELYYEDVDYIVYTSYYIIFQISLFIYLFVIDLTTLSVAQFIFTFYLWPI
jgi:hypothetical protein